MSAIGGECSDYERRFVSFLEELKIEGNREALGCLRRNLGNDVPDAEMLSVLFQYLPLGEDNIWKHKAYFTVASLFAVHPLSGDADSMGRTLRELADEPGIDERFTSLLDSSTEDLPRRLGGLIRRVAERNIPVNWEGLLKDLLEWEKEGKPVQYRWAQDFWGAGQTAGPVNRS